MSRITRLVTIAINYVSFLFFNLNVVYAQTATPSSESTPAASSTETLPEAGNFGLTLIFLAIGLAMIIFGIYIESKNRQKVN